MDLLVGLDLGTTSFKAAAYDLTGVEIATSRVPTPWISDANGARITATILETASTEVLADCLSKLEGNFRVLGLGITGMSESGFIVDSSGNAVTPAYSWRDESGADASAALRETFGTDQFSARTGLPISLRLSIVKAHMQISRVPSARENLVWLSLPEWVSKSLGGSSDPEACQAARTGMFNIGKRRWDADLLSWAGLAPTAMRAPRTAGESWGCASRGDRHIVGATITLAGQDHVCAALGANAVDATDVFDSLGTGEAVIRSVPADFDPDMLLKAVKSGFTVGMHVLPGRGLYMAGLGTGARLSHVLTKLGVAGSKEYCSLCEAALSAESPEPPRWVVEAIELGLTSAPVNSDTADGLGRAETWRAALDLASRRCAEAVQRLDAVAGNHERIVAAGGWFQSAAFTEMRRSILGEMIVPPTNEAASRGAAMLAGVAAGVYGTHADIPRPVATT